jgi:hypothetical protein
VSWNPDQKNGAMMIGQKHVIDLPGEAVGLVEVLHMAVDPFGVSNAIITQ